MLFVPLRKDISMNLLALCIWISELKTRDLLSCFLFFIRGDNWKETKKKTEKVMKKMFYSFNTMTTSDNHFIRNTFHQRRNCSEKELFGSFSIWRQRFLKSKKETSCHGRDKFKKNNWPKIFVKNLLVYIISYYMHNVRKLILYKWRL